MKILTLIQFIAITTKEGNVYLYLKHYCMQRIVSMFCLFFFNSFLLNAKIFCCILNTNSCCRCEECGKQFRNNKSLFLEHKLSHTQVR